MNLKLEWVNSVSMLDRLIPLKTLDEIESGDSKATPQKIAMMLAQSWRSGSYFIVANADSIDVGYGISTPLQPVDFYLINKVYIDPKYRKKGIATRIEQEQREHAKNLGLTKMVSAVDLDNLPSLRVQQKMGAKRLMSYPGKVIFVINC
jgi:RimJ/RimL family protein N-acetyltransferase